MPQTHNPPRSVELLQRQISERLSRLNNGFVRFERKDIEQSIPERFEQQVAKFPKCLAVQSRRYQFRYGELNGLANRIARAILATGGSAEQPVGLLLENDALVIAAMLAVLKTGRIYVPFDPGYPSGRMSYMLEDSRASILVTNNRNLPLARELASDHFRLLNIDEISTSVAGEDLCQKVPPDAIACILYTSGSTGRPKGICHTHRNLIQNIGGYTNAFHIGANDRLTMLHSSSFASAAVDIFCALLNGGSVHPWDVKELGLAGLADFLTSQRVTMLNWIPTPCRHFLSTLAAEQRFPDLRLVALGSEPFQVTDVELCRSYVSSNCILVNRLGTTETLNYCFYFIDSLAPAIGGALPAGYAVPDKEVLLLDDSGRCVTCGEVGEIAVRSPYLALGYWHKPKLTEAAFLSDPSDGACRTYLTGDLGRLRPDGCLEYLGRKDFQIKVRGHRIEVSEIEMILRQHPNIREAVVAGRTQPAGETYLVGYIEPRRGAELTVAEMRSFLRGKLPDHMVPTYFVFLDVLPITPSGKLDRGALPDPGIIAASPEHYVAPRTPLEEVLAEIWAEVLKLEKASIHDNFFELGGHSLLATRVVARVQARMGVEIPLKLMFACPTLAELALAIVERQAEQAGETVLSRVLAELEEASPGREDSTKQSS